MTAYAQEPIDFPSAPIDADTKATVELVAHDWRSDDDWRRFHTAAKTAAHYNLGEVDPSVVRNYLTRDGELTINPRRLSAFYHRAAGKSGFLDFSHWGINDDHKGRNAGRPCRIYKLRSNA